MTGNSSIVELLAIPSYLPAIVSHSPDLLLSVADQTSARILARAANRPWGLQIGSEVFGILTVFDLLPEAQFNRHWINH